MSQATATRAIELLDDAGRLLAILQTPFDEHPAHEDCAAEPPDWARRYESIRPYGFMIVLGLAILNVLVVLIVPVYVIIAMVISLST